MLCTRRIMLCDGDHSYVCLRATMCSNWSSSIDREGIRNEQFERDMVHGRHPNG